MSASSDAGAGAQPRTRALAVLLLLLIVGLPLAVVGSLLGARASLPATTGDQPGGRIEGRVVDAQGQALADHEVRLLLLPDGGPSERFAAAATDASGAFGFDAPALRGKYALSAGGGPYVRTLRELSFLDPRGERVELEPLELRLDPGCVLTVRLERATERFSKSGRFELRGRLLEGWAFDLVRPSLRLDGEFDGAQLELGGLPPLEGTLMLFLDNGDEVELPLRLEVGESVRELPL